MEDPIPVWLWYVSSLIGFALSLRLMAVVEEES
jgi:hypothetical protein